MDMRDHAKGGCPAAGTRQAARVVVNVESHRALVAQVGCGGKLSKCIRDRLPEALCWPDIHERNW